MASRIYGLRYLSFCRLLNGGIKPQFFPKGIDLFQLHLVHNDSSPSFACSYQNREDEFQTTLFRKESGDDLGSSSLLLPSPSLANPYEGQDEVLFALDAIQVYSGEYNLVVDNITSRMGVEPSPFKIASVNIIDIIDIHFLPILPSLPQSIFTSVLIPLFFGGGLVFIYRVMTIYLQ